MGSGDDSQAGAVVDGGPSKRSGIPAICCAFSWMQRAATHSFSGSAEIGIHSDDEVSSFCAHQSGMIEFQRLMLVPSSGSTSRFASSPVATIG